MWSRHKRARRRHSGGFVLVEVLVTAAVAAVLLAALMRAFSSTWSGIGAVREETEAMLVARAVIEASTPRTNLAPLTQEGMSGRYAWMITIANTGIQAAAATGEQTQRRPGLPGQPGPQPGTGRSFEEQPNAGGPVRMGQGDNTTDRNEEEAREQPWNLFRIAVAVRAPSGRRTTLETFRLSRPAPR